MILYKYQAHTTHRGDALMNTIIQQICEKMIKSTNKILKMVLEEGKGISDFTINISKTLDEVGVDLTHRVFELVYKMKRVLHSLQDKGSSYRLPGL